MSTRKKFEEKIIKKQQENLHLQSKVDSILSEISENNIHIQVWTEALKILPKDEATPSPIRQRRIDLRPGSDMDKARQALLAAKKPLHINDLVLAMGRDDTKETRISIASSIQAYVRRDVVFKKTAPNTFGLIESSNTTQEESNVME